MARPGPRFNALTRRDTPGNPGHLITRDTTILCFASGTSHIADKCSLEVLHVVFRIFVPDIVQDQAKVARPNILKFTGSI